MRILALDHGSARCGVAVSDPTGTLATPLGAVERPDTKRGLAALARLVEDQGAERVVVGLPLTMTRRGGRAGRAGADVCRAARAESLGTGGASRRAPYDATRGAHRGRGRCRLAGCGPPARELPGSHQGGHPRVSSGPPPVPGGRTPEEREAARLEREARRAARDGHAPTQTAPPPPTIDGLAENDGEPRDWLSEAQALTQDEPALPRTRRKRRAPGRIIALGVLLLIVAGIAWFANALFQPFKGDGGERGHGQHPAGLEPVPDRRHPRAARRGRGRRLLPAPRPPHRPQRRSAPGLLRDAQGHELHRRARRAPGGRAAERGAGGHPRGSLAHGDPAAHQGAPGQLRAREPTLPAAQPGRLQGAPRREPRGLPLPGDLRAQEGPAGQGAGQRPAARSSSRTSARWTCATRGART